MPGAIHPGARQKVDFKKNIARNNTDVKWRGKNGDVGNIEERSFPTVSGSSVGDGALSGKTSSNTIIPDSQEESNSNFVYSYNAEKEKEANTRRTLHAVVNQAAKNDKANVQTSNNSIYNS